MMKLLQSARWLAISLLLASLLPAQPAAALTAEEYFADGNRLFRDDLYWAALLRYRQAQEEGYSSTTLQYNLGVAHYRAGQYTRSREALLQSLNDPGLRVASQYNLGLAAYQLGNTEEALRWFRLARDQEQSKKIQKFAVIAISRIRDEQAVPDEFEVRIAEREKKRNFYDLDFTARLGFGNDDNVFRSPNQTYIDFSDPNLPVVTPVVRDGAFIPLQLGIKYRLNTLPFEGFFTRYKLSGRYYQDETLENANEYQHELSFGSDYKRREGSRNREIYSAFTIAQHDETYYDRDDGTEREVDGTPIGARLNYLRYGPEISLRQAHERLAIGARFKGQLWNYDEIASTSEYDHEYFHLNLYGQYEFAPGSLLRISVEGYSRRFGDRPAFDLDGQQRVGNPNIRYDYYAVRFTTRQRIFDSLWFGFDLERTERLDKYVGYNDYQRDSFSAEIHWAPWRRFNIGAEGTYSLYNYDNAFAFHNPASGTKTQESARIRVKAQFRITPRLSLVADARYRETVSTDTRIQYERNQYHLGVLWEQ